MASAVLLGSTPIARGSGRATRGLGVPLEALGVPPRGLSELTALGPNRLRHWPLAHAGWRVPRTGDH